MRARETVELFLAVLAGPVRQPTSVAREGDIGDAFLLVGEAQGFAAVGSHHVELVAGFLVLGGVAVGQEHEEAAVRGPLRRGLVLSLRERQLPGRGHALLERHQVDVGLLRALLPVRRAQRVEQPLAVGARRRRARLSHVLHVEERHRAQRRRLLTGQRGGEAGQQQGAEQSDGDGGAAESGRHRSEHVASGSGAPSLGAPDYTDRASRTNSWLQ